jgi:hypothetical protein
LHTTSDVSPRSRRSKARSTSLGSKSSEAADRHARADRGQRPRDAVVFVAGNDDPAVPPHKALDGQIQGMRGV